MSHAAARSDTGVPDGVVPQGGTATIGPPPLPSRLVPRLRPGLLPASDGLRPRDIAASVALLAVLLGLWWLASHRQWVSKVFLPTPEATLGSLLEGLRDGELAAFTGATLLRMLVGWLLASLLGVLLGVLIGSSAALRAWLQPTLEFIRPLPASALLPPAIALFGLSPTMVLTVVAFGAMWPVLLATVHGLASVHAALHEVSRSLQLSRTAFVFKIGLPNALPASWPACGCR